MSERSKYAKNGICRVENFAEHLAAGTFPRIELDRLCGMKWYSVIEIDSADNEIFPIIYSDNDDPTVKHSVKIYYNLLDNSEKNKKTKEKRSREVLLFDVASIGFYASILEILDPKNGWLNDGTLSFEYGIQVEAIMKHKIWRFNSNDMFFNRDNETAIKTFDRKLKYLGYLLSHIFKYHSHDLQTLSLFGKQLVMTEDREKFRLLQDSFQILHGVHIRMTHKRLFQVLSVASENKLTNVICYCDFYLAQKRGRSRYRKNEKKWMNLANYYNLRHWMVELLKPMKTVKDCIDDKDVENLSNESMKLFLAKFLYEKF